VAVNFRSVNPGDNEDRSHGHTLVAEIPNPMRIAGKHGEKNMLNLELGLVMQGKEVPINSISTAIAREVRASVSPERSASPIAYPS